MNRLFNLISKVIVSGFLCLPSMNVGCYGSEGSFDKDGNEHISSDEQETSESLDFTFYHHLDRYCEFIASRYFESFVDMYNLAASTKALRRNAEKFFHNPFPIIGTRYISKKTNKDDKNVIKQGSRYNFFDLLKKYFPNIRTFHVYTRADLNFVLANINSLQDLLKTNANKSSADPISGILITLKPSENYITFSQYHILKTKLEACGQALTLNKNTEVLLDNDSIKEDVGIKNKEGIWILDKVITKVQDNAKMELIQFAQNHIPCHFECNGFKCINTGKFYMLSIK